MSFTFLLLNVNFCNFLSGKFFKIIIRVTFHLNFLTGDNFKFVFVDHLSFNLQIGIIIWWFWEIMLTGITCGRVFYNELIGIVILLLLFEFFVIKYFLGYGHFRNIGLLLWKRRCFCWRYLSFRDGSLFIN